MIHYVREEFRLGVHGQRSDLVHLTVVVQLIGSVLLALSFLIMYWSDPTFPFFPFWVSLAAILSCGVAWWLVRGGWSTLAAAILVAGPLITVGGAYLAFGGFRGPATILFFWPILIASTLIDLRTGIFTAAIAALFHALTAYLTWMRVITPPDPHTMAFADPMFTASGVIMFFMVALWGWLFSDRLKTVTTEVQSQAAELNTQLAENKRLVARLQDTALQLAPLTDALAVTMEQIGAAAREIASTASLMAHGAEDQSRQIEAASRSMAQLAANTRQIAGNLHEAGQASTHAEAMVQNAALVIESLSQQLSMIDEVVTLVDKIADKTNLLALNASIEAARAGEHGAGFAVVADEVGRLAESSASLVGEISVLSKEIGRRLEQTLNTMQEAKSGTTRSAALAQSVEAATEGQEEASEAMVEAVDRIAHVADENALASEQISTSVEEQVASIERVAGSAQELAELIAGLKQMLESWEADHA